jgi:hypothetical protein
MSPSVLPAERATTTSDPLAYDVLNLGCGAKKLPAALNVDAVDTVRPDRVIDLNARPWPLPTGRFREIHAYDVVEHLDDVVGTFEEIHRVGRAGAVVYVTVPHFSSANAFTDPTHKHYFGEQSFHYLTGEHEHAHYTRVRFRRLESRVVFQPTLLNKAVSRLANARPAAYEQRWAWMFPAWFLFVRLEILK